MGVFRSFGSTKNAGVKAAGSKPKVNPPKLKKNITPGSVLILLAGRFRGKRVVFIKMLESGLLLVTGPFSVNGVPLRRVNQRYCIATSAKVDLKGSDYSSVNDGYFKREATKGKKEPLTAESEKTGPSSEKVAGQSKMDGPLAGGLAPDMKAYLKARFSLSAQTFPHELKF